jgi:hypothetical protein
MWLEVRNELSGPIRLLSDSCVRRTLLGEVAAGSSTRLRIPDHVFDYAGLLRFHAYSVDPRQRIGSYGVPAEVPTAHLLLNDEMPTLAATHSGGPLDPSAWIDPVLVFQRGESQATSVFASGTQSVLTWQCVEGTLLVSFAATLPLSGDPEITVSGLGLEPVSLGTWSRVDHITDSALAPAEGARQLTRLVQGRRFLTVHASTEPDIPQGHQFDVVGLEEGLSSLTCLDQIPGLGLTPPASAGS